ncbi:enkurin-like isoform X1 [Selaginella moellendorffii]|uniref:enkurin-like isoform X1 n=1 Tax=Selaginella moellendorffii TaxID=88036 RepID=UPI000D1CB2F1|nr:enkurin-like isoform X1 [Selaginella moellendorffii]|eukprot:XP_024526753.1 enkurin-like isoform X1 [Selaginella moellendorffii]
MLLAPKKLPKPVKFYVDKSDYGKVPEYLVKFNNASAELREKMQAAIRLEQLGGLHPNSRKLDEAEKRELIILLKEKWQQVNEEYQKLPFSLDTPAKKKRKERCLSSPPSYDPSLLDHLLWICWIRYEEHLGQIEKDIQTLSRRVVIVVDKGKSQSSGSSGRRR